MLKPAVEPHFARRSGNLANSAKLMVTGADYFGDVGLHCELTVEIKNAKYSFLMNTIETI